MTPTDIRPRPTPPAAPPCPIRVARRSDVVLFHSCRTATLAYTFDLHVTAAAARFEMEFCSERSDHRVGRMRLDHARVDGTLLPPGCFGLKEEGSPDAERVLDRYLFRHDFAAVAGPGDRTAHLVLVLEVTDGFDRVRDWDTFIVHLDHPTDQLDVMIHAAPGYRLRAVPFPRTASALLLKPRSDHAGERPAPPDPLETADGRVLWNCRRPAIDYGYEIGLRLEDAPAPPPAAGAGHPPDLLRQLDDANAFDRRIAAGEFNDCVGRWVAFGGGQRLGHGDDPQTLRDACAAAAAALGVPKGRILLEYIESPTDLV